MAKGGKKKGPPYLDEPDCKYVVIVDPWGMVNAQDRKEIDVHRVGAWIRFMLREQGNGTDIQAEAVYMRSTQNEVIAQLPWRTNIEPMLGEHRWPEFLNTLRGPNSTRTASYIFEYNYRNNGEPGNHNWSDYYPTSDLPPNDFPVKFPYPRAHYADATRLNHLRSLILPLPGSRQRTPSPPPDELYPEVKSENQEVPIHPDPAVKTEEIRQPSYIEKYDPYEEEEAANRLLQYGETKREPIDHQVPSVTVKKEVVVKEEDVLNPLSDYQASSALLESLATLPEHNFTRNHQEVTVKAEPVANEISTSSGYAASEALAQAIHQFQSQRPPISDDVSALVIKTEPTHSTDTVPQPSTATRDPRRRPLNNISKRLQEEEEDHGLVKKVKIERNW